MLPRYTLPYNALEAWVPIVAPFDKAPFFANRYGKKGNLSLRLQSSRPDGVLVDPQLHLYLHPSCTYKVVITKAWTTMLGQVSLWFVSVARAFQRPGPEMCSQALAILMFVCTLVFEAKNGIL